MSMCLLSFLILTLTLFVFLFFFLSFLLYVSVIKHRYDVSFCFYTCLCLLILACRFFTYLRIYTYSLIVHLSVRPIVIFWLPLSISTFNIYNILYLSISESVCISNLVFLFPILFLFCFYHFHYACLCLTTNRSTHQVLYPSVHRLSLFFISRIFYSISIYLTVYESMYLFDSLPASLSAVLSI
jgi:hypothetical protein